MVSAVAAGRLVVPLGDPAVSWVDEGTPRMRGPGCSSWGSRGCGSPGLAGFWIKRWPGACQGTQGHPGWMQADSRWLSAASPPPNLLVRRRDFLDPQADGSRQAACQRAIVADGHEPQHGHPRDCILCVMASWREEFPQSTRRQFFGSRIRPWTRMEWQADGSHGPNPLTLSEGTGHPTAEKCRHGPPKDGPHGIPCSKPKVSQQVAGG